ncbi:MAG: SCO family protein [Calditrichaeota bacterium]|nr:SCO family protein [Candidatus Cloacimonadota bacterium]MCB1045854.1 SCO family protein [Calditrichota bacterium]MCB9473722.1 SCO family protein [Candidatus Delongbacteria bacterium]
MTCFRTIRQALTWTRLWLLLCLPLMAWSQNSIGDPADEIAFVEHLGGHVPGSVEFIDENGQPVRLDSLIHKPTILMMVYYTCPGICTPLLNEVAAVIGRTSLIPGDDYMLLAVSFDPTDTPELARQKQANYISSVDRQNFRPEHWRFLTGSQEAITALSDSVGFRYKETGGEFIHAGGLIVLAPDGKIVRYLYGTDFLPFDFRMALVEARSGKIMPSISRVLAYCFSYDPESRTYVFALFKVFGIVMLFFIAGLAIFLVYAGRNRTRKAQRD